MSTDREEIGKGRAGFRGFTLVELMVAMAITSMLAVVMLTMLSGVLGHWQTTETRIDAYTDGRAALKLIRSELQGAFPELNGKAAIVAGGSGDSQTLQFVTDIYPVVQPGTESQSDVCGVEYFVAPAQNGNGQALYRTLLTSKVTFERMTGAEGAPFSEPPAVTHPNTELISPNVVRFTVVLRDTDYRPLTDPDTAPKYAEITLEVIGRRNADAYFAAAPGLKAKILREEGRTFTQRTTL